MLPARLPGESLFSRISRGHAISGLTESQYLETVLGNGRLRVHPFLAANIGVIASLTTEGKKDIIRHQTLSPLFAYFLPQHHDLLYSSQSSLQQVTRACQFSAWRGNEVLSVKSCPLCLCEDIREHGVSYWHIVHQIPGVEACYKHGVWLFHHPLSGRSHLNEAPFLFAKSEGVTPCSQTAMNFAKFAKRRFNDIKKSPSESTGDYLECLEKSGFVTSARSIRTKALVSQLTDICVDILPIDSPYMPPLSRENQYWSSVLHGKYSQPPFKHLVLEFLLNRDKGTHASPPAIMPTTQTDNIETHCLALLEQGLSLSEVGRQILKSRCYVKGVAMKFGINHHFKPKKITQAIQERIKALAYKGFHRKAIAEELGVSSGSVEMVISTTEGLVDWRKHCRYESRKRRYKCQILRFMQSHPKAIRQDIKRNREASFFWLYTHDREWLDTNLPKACKPLCSERIDWKKRDAELFHQVLELLSHHEVTSRTELDRALGSHGWLISKKAKFPRTMLLLKAFSLN
ncbi:TnsD family transposase [Enterovibrio norvegicus]|uniref:TnsD family Tn7-like transposition protein n=1 Tax=Enterovibrio norvegicus TaxID=188144 RepID=UPI003D0D9D21